MSNKKIAICVDRQAVLKTQRVEGLQIPSEGVLVQRQLPGYKLRSSLVAMPKESNFECEGQLASELQAHLGQHPQQL